MGSRRRQASTRTTVIVLSLSYATIEAVKIAAGFAARPTGLQLAALVTVVTLATTLSYFTADMTIHTKKP